MVERRLSDGHRIAELLASELAVDVGPLRHLTVVDAVSDADPSVDGRFAFGVQRFADPGQGGGELVAETFLQPDRVYVEFRVSPHRVAEIARDQGLRVRPKAVQPPRTIVFLEDGAQVKRILDAFCQVAGPDHGGSPEA